MAWNEPGGGNNSNDQDPWGSGGNRGGNRGGKQGPPDLDEALRKLQDSLNNLFGSGKRSGNGGSDRGNGSGAGVPGWIWGLALVVVLGFWAFKAVYMVNEQEQAVILRFGEYHRTVGPGLHLYFPPVESKFQRNVTQVRSYRQKGQMLTFHCFLVETILL